MANMTFEVTMDVEALKALPVAKNATYPVKQVFEALERGFRDADITDAMAGRVDEEFLAIFTDAKNYIADFIHSRANMASHSNKKTPEATVIKNRNVHDKILAIVKKLGCSKPLSAKTIADAMTKEAILEGLDESYSSSGLTNRLKDLIEEGWCTRVKFSEVKGDYEFTEKETPSDKGAWMYSFHAERFMS